MIDFPNGEYVRGYLASSDISTAAAIPLFDRAGVARVLAAGEQLIVESIIINNGDTAALVTIFGDLDADGAIDSGEEVYSHKMAANAQSYWFGPLAVKPVVAAGGALKAIGSIASANTRIVLIGFILKR